MNDAIARLATERQALARLDSDRPLEPGQLTPRQRIDMVVDAGSFLEFGGLARSQQDDRATDTLTDGVIVGWATVAGREVAVLAEDPLVAAHTDGQVAKNKRHRLLTLAMARQRPVVCLLDGAEPAVAKPYQGRLFGHLARQHPLPRLDQLDAPLIAVVLGRLTGWALEFAVQADVVLVGPSAEFDGADLAAADDSQACTLTRSLMAGLPAGTEGALEFDLEARPQVALDDEVDVHAPLDRLLAGLLDHGTELVFGNQLGFRSGLGRLFGLPVAYIATGGAHPGEIGPGQLRAIRTMVRLTRKLQFPLICLQDCLGYEPGAATTATFLTPLTELLQEMRASTAPLVCVVTGQGQVIGNFALGGRQLGFDYIAALPWATVPVTDPPSAESPTGPWLAAGMGLIDDILEPGELRQHLFQILRILCLSRGLPSLESQRGPRVVDDIAKV